MTTTIQLKSLHPDYEDSHFQSQSGAASFISFERAVRLEQDYCKSLGKPGNPIGFKVTQDGIYIFWDRS